MGKTQRILISDRKNFGIYVVGGNIIQTGNGYSSRFGTEVENVSKWKNIMLGHRSNFTINEFGDIYST